MFLGPHGGNDIGSIDGGYPGGCLGSTRGHESRHDVANCGRRRIESVVRPVERRQRFDL